MSSTDKFAWLEPLTPSTAEIPAEVPVVPDRYERIKKLRPFAPWIGITIAFAVLMSFRREAPARIEGGAPTTIEVVAPVLPLAPRTTLRNDQFQIFPVRKSQLTKTQLQDIVRPEQVRHFNGTIRTRKLVSPDRPLRWSDLEWTKPERGAGRPQVFYGNPGKDTP